ncbi:MAG TPA: phosphohistidine phosphatase [Oceanithermus profundus]|uniref:Phosphohistidine phosphatase n=1 Tax=Oceanithermus profundus TaxID=187137 RepID=A0A7C4Z402_9DEIN|nr:phosphohistidine phosphatase [Oceanithermus profundus]
MTEVHLIRHARAQPRREGLPDGERALTPAGEAQAERLRTALERLEVRYALLWTSPLLRARQTADHLAPLAEVVAEEEALAGPWDAGLLDRLLVRGSAVAVVAHEPDLSRVAAELLAGDPQRAAAFAFKKSGLLALRMRPRGAELRYGLTPGVLRRVLDPEHP